MSPGRQLAFLAAIFVILAGWAYLGGSGGFSERLHPRLGQDLVGGTRVALKAITPGGGVPNQTDLEQARNIIQQRVDGLGVSEAEVTIEGQDTIVVQVTGRSEDLIKDVGQAAQMFFRKVVNVTDGSEIADPTATPSANPSGSATPNPSTQPSATPSAKASGSGGGAVMAEPSATPSAAASAAPSASSGNSPAKVTLEQVQAKVGKPAWDAASALTAPLTDASQLQVLAPFMKLSGPEVAVLDPKMQFNLPQISCRLLAERPAGSISDPKKQAVACGNEGQKLFLDVAKVNGTDIAKATPALDAQSGGQWEVGLTFTGDGTEKWTNLTREAFQNSGDPKCEQAALGGSQHCRVAVVLDNKVVSSPEIQGVLSDKSRITGSFGASEARELANYLNYGSLAMTFEQQEAQSVTASLGSEHLKAGLLAAGIGMLLVIIYSFFYYRLLGTVIFLSLLISGAMTFFMLVILGRQIGFTLTLAGIAGFIVSLGVAADSFVIYFERLKDEIREGRNPRSAVQRAWGRARRTILTANAISLMAAVVLYLISSGPVAGFAFALGLATALDLIVVFLFRHPIMSMFARTDAFLSPRVSGLGRVLHEAKEAKS